MPPTVVIIGGGSYNWTPTIISDIVLTPELDGTHIVLEDIAPEPLAVMQKFGEKMIAENNSACTLSSTTDEAAALEKADFVVVTISTGGFETMEKDLAIPLKYGVNQTVGDSVGPGGLSRALRNIPVMVGIAKNMERQCPDAWLINYTNPMSTLCLAVERTTGVKTVGLCHELQGVLYILKAILKAPENAAIDIQVAGVNHFIWLLSLEIDGRNGFEMLREWLKNPAPFDVQDQELKEMFAPSTIDRAKLKFELFQKYGSLPAAGDRHIAEFFDCYLKDFGEAEQRYGIKPTSIKERGDSWLAAMRAYVHGMLDETFPLPSKKSSEAISEILAALAGEVAPQTDVLNLPNAGQVENLPDSAIVETLGRLCADEARALGPLRLPQPIRELVLPHAENQFLAVKAALEGNRTSAREFLRRDPLSRNCTAPDKMLDELLEAHSKYLPRFR